MAKAPDDPIDILDRFLMSDRAPDSSMGVSDIDGLLTGIVIGPEIVLPSEWLTVVWGGEKPAFKNVKEAQTVNSALMEWYNEVVHAFQHTPPVFDPVYWETADGIVIAADWAEGFNDAMKLRPKAWKALLDDPVGSRLLNPIRVLCGEGGEVVEPNLEAQLMREAGDQLSDSIIGIHRYWKSRRA